MRKRIFSLFLCAVLLLSLLPTAALAEALPEQTQEQSIAPADVTEAPEQEDAVAAVQAMIDALPTVQTVSAADYDAVQAAFDAYEALNADQQAQITGAEVFEALFAWFNGQVTATDDECVHAMYKVGEYGYYQCANEACNAFVNGYVEGIVNGETVTRCFVDFKDAISYAVTNCTTATVKCLFRSMDGDNGFDITIEGKAKQKLTLDLYHCGQHNTKILNIKGDPSFEFNMIESTGYSASIGKLNVYSGNVNIYGGGCYGASRSSPGLYVYGGNVTLYDGKFSKIDTSSVEGLTIGSLLADGCYYEAKSGDCYTKSSTETTVGEGSVNEYQTQSFTVAGNMQNKVRYDSGSNTYTLNVTYGDADIDLDAIFSAVGTVTFELQNPDAEETAVSEVPSEARKVLKIIKAGSATVSATAAATGKYKEATTTIKIQVAKATPEIPKDLTVVYGEKLSTVELPEGWAWVNGDQKVSQPVSDTAYPYLANYTPNDENHEPLSNYNLNVKVTKAELTITGVTAVNRQYEAENTTVALTGGTLVGVLEGDDVDFTLGTGTVADAAIGEDKAVTTNIQLTGADSGNYTLTQPTDLTVTIFCNHGNVDGNYDCDDCKQQMVARIGSAYYSTLEAAVEAAVSEDTIEILRDIVVENVVRIAKKVTVTSVDSEKPCQITSNTDKHGYLLSADENGEVTLTNIIVDGGSERNLTAEKAAIAVNGGKLIVNSGTIVRNNDHTYFNSDNEVVHTIGGGICVISGELEVNGGTITGNHAYLGGGIGLYDGLVTVNSGAVVSNNSNDIKDHNGTEAQTVGGGIGVTGGELVINGGTITGNYAYFGGGIGLFDGSATVKAEAGSITGNTARVGGGITVWEYVTLDSSTGEYRPTHTGTLHIGGGVSVTGNHATYYAGGIHFHWGTVYISGHPYLAGNTTDGDQYNKKETNSGIYLDGQSTSYSPVILEEALTEGAVISFYSWFGKDGTVICNPDTGYTITETDLSYLSYEDDAYYLARIDGNVVLKSKAAPTGTAPEALIRIYTGDEQTLVKAGTYTGGTVYYRQGETGTWATTLPAGTEVGSYPIYWKVVGDAQHTDLPETLITAKIEPQSISIDGNGNGGANGEGGYSLIIDSTCDLVYDGTAKTPGITILDGNDLTVPASEYTVRYEDNINAGTAKIIITDAEGGNYTVSGSTTFQILKAEQHPTASDVVAVYGDTDKVITVSDAVGEVSYEVTDGADVVTVAANGALTILKAGSATVSIAAAGNENYNPATLTVSITVNKAEQHPTASDVVAVYGDTDKAITVSNAVGEVTYEVTDGADVVEVAENGALTILKAGSATVSIAAAGNGNYKPATLTVSITVNKAEQHPTASDVEAVYGDTDKVITVSNAVGEVSYEVTDGADVVTVDENGSLSFLRAGSAVVTVTAAGDSNHKEGSCTANITVSKRAVTVTALDKKAYVYAKAPDLSSPVLDRDYTISGVLSGDTLDSSVTVTLAYEDGLDMKRPGKYDIIPAVAGEDSRYSFICVNGTLNVRCLPVVPSTPSKPDNSHPGFIDVPDDSYFKDAVDWAVDNGITNGVSSNLFAPDGICTRAQAVTFLWRMSGCPTPRSTQMPFVDVAVNSYYYEAVLWAVENGITVGTSATTFSPDENCSRAHIVTFLWRASGKPVVAAANPFADVSSAAYYTDAVLWAVANRITLGTGAATFSPDADCTRAQIVTFIYRAQ